jgi:hypothetical protein
MKVKALPMFMVTPLSNEFAVRRGDESQGCAAATEYYVN